MQSLPRKPKERGASGEDRKGGAAGKTIEFELDEEEHLFDVGEVTPVGGKFYSGGEGRESVRTFLAQQRFFSGQETSWKGRKPSVRQELKKIETEQRQRRQAQKSRRKPRNQQRKKKKVKGR